MAIEDYFVHTATVYSVDQTQNSTGEWIDSETLVDEIECAISPQSSVKEYSNGKETFNYTDVLYTNAPNSNIQAGYTVIYESLKYEIISVINPLLMDHHLKVLMVRKL